MIKKEAITPTKKKNAGIITPANETKATESEMNIPDYAIERLARAMLPLIQKYYESEEAQKELKQWINASFDKYTHCNLFCSFAFDEYARNGKEPSVITSESAIGELI